MPLIKIRSSLGANAQVFPLQGNQYEILTFDALVEFALLSDAGGVVNGTVHSGTDLLMSNTLLDVLAVANPIAYPDHYSLSDYAEEEDRLGVEIQESAGAAGPTLVRTAAKITPI